MKYKISANTPSTAFTSYRVSALAIALTFFILSSLSAGKVAAQSALDEFNPDANNTVRAVAVQPDGKILIGGDFTMVRGVARNRIARLNPDGSLDTAFDPNANGIIYAIVLQPDGKILVGGQFSGANSIGGQPRNRIARLDGDKRACRFV